MGINEISNEDTKLLIYRIIKSFTFEVSWPIIYIRKLERKYKTRHILTETTHLARSDAKGRLGSGSMCYPSETARKRERCVIDTARTVYFSESTDEPVRLRRNRLKETPHDHDQD